MFGHLVEPILLQPFNSETSILHSVVHVVILPSPAPERVGEAVDQLEVLPGHGSDPTEDLVVGHRVVEGGHLGGHVQGELGGAVVQVGLVHREEVDVVKDGARIVEIFHGLNETNI